jgi:hypothetical protein
MGPIQSRNRVPSTLKSRGSHRGERGLGSNPGPIWISALVPSRLESRSISRRRPIPGLKHAFAQGCLSRARLRLLHGPRGERPRLTAVAPTLTSFSHRLVSDHGSTSLERLVQDVTAAAISACGWCGFGRNEALCAGRTIGSRTWKLEPSPSLLSTEIAPP